MTWRWAVGLVVVAVLSLAAAAVAIVSVGGPSGAERIKEAIRWPTTCEGISTERPSTAPIMRRWAAFTTQTADIVCGAAGARVSYASFRDEPMLNRAIAAQSPTRRYCLVGTSVVIDDLAGVDPTVFTDMCLSLQGTFVNSER